MSSGTGSALRLLRTAANMTLAELAEVTGSSTSYLSRVETGKAAATTAWVASIVEATGTRIPSDEPPIMVDRKTFNDLVGTMASILESQPYRPRTTTAAGHHP